MAVVVLGGVTTDTATWGGGLGALLGLDTCLQHHLKQELGEQSTSWAQTAKCFKSSQMCTAVWARTEGIPYCVSYGSLQR